MPLPQIWSLNPIYKQQLHYLYNMTHFCFFIRKETSKMIGSQWSVTHWGMGKGRNFTFLLYIFVLFV